MDKEKEVLEEIYNVCNEIFKNYEECFYTTEEVKDLKTKKENIFI